MIITARSLPIDAQNSVLNAKATAKRNMVILAIIILTHIETKRTAFSPH